MRIVDTTIATTLLLATGLALTAPAALRGQTAAPENASNRCRELVDDSGNRLGGEVVVTWTVRREASQSRHLDLQCRTLGPIVLRAEPADNATKAGGRSLVVVDWNVHVGGGDLDRLLDQLAAGELNGVSRSDYVLLIQEAYRGDGLVPASIESGVRVPRRITPRPKEHAREDIVSIARRRGLALYYVPSMRNGQGWPYEDRGNAILSTLPLGDLAAIELPIDRQRRVAISATVRGVDAQSRPWRLRLVTVHLDAFVGAKRLWIFATGWRGRQARTVLDALDQNEPAVIGADLNTWLAGRWESAYRRFANALPASPTASTGAASDAHGRVDYVFFRLPSGWVRRSGRLERDFGSDHRPIVGRIHYPE